MPRRRFDDQYDDIWRYERFITTIEQKAGISWEKAEAAARATLTTLAERIAPGSARDLAADLPDELARPLLDASPGAESFDVEEFVRRVAVREGVDTDTAERHAKAVFIALARLVRNDEVAHAFAELPKDYKRLLAEARQRSRDESAAEVLPFDEFLERVAGRAGLPPDQARRAAEAVLETLAERITGGEVDDVAESLPAELRVPLMRGKERSGGKAARISLDEFVGRVADREGVTWEEALEHAQAVFSTLREGVSDKEWSDILDELPRAYQEPLLGTERPGALR